ncbi:MAG: iron-sulfur cluster assembly accessory protein [Beggiatoa sp. IS2]|nr:MAG: iron-sulfur cluster assembly accessory protein [Beggiatoa sp. IS2]
MFKITPSAADQILKSAQENHVSEFALRLAARRHPDGSIEYGMGFDEIREEDVHLFCEGVDIVFNAAYKELLNGAVMDYVELAEGDFRFIFLNPNDPEFLPPQE